MSLIITFMFEPAKLQMNCASASGARNLRRETAALTDADSTLMTPLERKTDRTQPWTLCARCGEDPRPPQEPQGSVHVIRQEAGTPSDVSRGRSPAAIRISGRLGARSPASR